MNMKKYIVIIASVLLAAVSCAKFEHETPIAKDPVVNALTIETTAVGDSVICFTVTPGNGTSYYSYAVVAGEAAKMDSSKLFALNVSGAIVKKTVDANKTAVAVDTAKALTPFSSYTIYAVAANVQGTIGTVVTKTVKTTDSTKPTFKPTLTDTSAILTFDTAVSKSELSKVFVRYFVADTTKLGDNVCKDSLEAKVTVAGNVATINCGKIPAGAYWSITVPEGTFVDASGQECKGVKSGYTRVLNPSTGKKVPAGVGLYGHKPNKAFGLSVYGDVKKEGVKLVVDLTKPLWLNVNTHEDSPIKKESPDSTGTITYKYKSGDKEQETFKYVYGVDFGIDGAFEDETLIRYYPNVDSELRPDPDRGSEVTIVFPSGVLTDIYGNQNTSFQVGPFLYSYGFGIEDVAGVWEFDGKSCLGLDEDPWTFTFEKSDDAEAGNVMITSYYGFDNLKLYCDFDGDQGILTIPLVDEDGYFLGLGWKKDESKKEAYFYSIASLDGYGYFSSDQKYKMTTSKEFSGMNAYFGYYVEVYTLPDSGKIEDIVGDDYKGEDFDFCNFFGNLPEWVSEVPAPTAATSSFSVAGNVKANMAAGKMHRSLQSLKKDRSVSRVK